MKNADITKKLVFLIGTAALAACGGNGADDETESGTGDVAQEENGTAPGTHLIEGGISSPVGEDTSGDMADAAIPAAIQGRWGMVALECQAAGAAKTGKCAPDAVPADCTTTLGDAKGLLEIDATSLKFYESRGTLAEVAESDSSRIRANFDFSGEGMTWQRDEVLEAQDGGKTLVRREYGEGALPGTFLYKRCPA